MGNLDKLKEQFEKFKNSKSLNSKSGSSKTQFKPGPEEANVRLLPWDGTFDLQTLESLMKETFVHYKIHSSPFYCPSRNFNEKSHVQEYASELWSSNDPASQKAAKKLFSSPRYLFLVLVRGQEEDGPKIWETSKQASEEVINLVLTEDKEILADGGVLGENCLDLKVSTYEHRTPDGTFTKTKVSAGRKSTPLLPKSMKKSLKELQEMAPDPYSLHEKVTSDQTMEILEKYMNDLTKSEEKENQKYGNSQKSELSQKAAEVRESSNDEDDDIPF